jgi:hypothetical protein
VWVLCCWRYRLAHCLTRDRATRTEPTICRRWTRSRSQRDLNRRRHDVRCRAASASGPSGRNCPSRQQLLTRMGEPAMTKTLITTALALGLGLLSTPSFAAGSYIVNGQAGFSRRGAAPGFQRRPAGRLGGQRGMASHRQPSAPASPPRPRPSPAARSAITSSTCCCVIELRLTGCQPSVASVG